MAKFNVRNRLKSVNHEGTTAWRSEAKQELYALVVTSLMEDKFYESSEEQLKRMQKLIRKTEPEFVKRLAVYAREEMHLRSVPLLLVMELARNGHPEGLAEVLERVITRADGITEALACYQMVNKRKGAKKLKRLSNQVRKGVGSAFNSFDEYQFARYNRKGEITLKDALFLTHPKAKDKKQQELFDRIVSGNLSVPYTWEVQVSYRGNNAETWEELIDSGRVGYMALLRNLRNILQASVSRQHLEEAARIISNPDRVRKSKQLPFRFFSAYREISPVTGSGIFIDALEAAVRSSAENIEFFQDEDILIASDVSGSMMTRLSPQSKVEYYDVGLLLSMLLKNRLGDRVTTGIFGSSWKVKNLPTKGILGAVDYLRSIEGEVGYATNGYRVLKWALKTRKRFDRILFFTDCQLYNTGSFSELAMYWKAYRKLYPEAKVYFIDMTGYGTTPLQVSKGNVYSVSGWSDRIFDILLSLENGAGAVEKIEAIKLSN